MQFKVPFGRPAIQQPEIDEVVATLRSGWLVAGPKVRQFEEEFKEYTGAAHAIALNSCTAALQLCMMSAGIGPGDEVITTPLTFVATANSIVHTGAVPVFADIDPDTQTISPETVADRITARTKAILPVHLAGRAVEFGPLQELAAAHGITVISDAAHAVETRYQGAHVATLGRAAAFSFQATKNVTTGEGGMVTTSDAELAKKVRILRSHGLDKDAWRRHGDPRDSTYDAVLPGYKYGMSDVAAAIGIHQLRRVEANLAIRRDYVRRYDEAFANVPELTLPDREPSGANGKHAHHLYTVLLDLDRLTIGRDQFVDALRGLGIGCGVHYRVVHLQRYYRERFGFAPGDYPVSEYISDRTVSLPLSAAMTVEDLDEVVNAVSKVISANRR